MAELRLEKRGRYWQYIFEGAKINGKRNRITKSGFKTKAEASEAGAKAMSEYNESGLHFTPSEMSFNDFLDYWVESYCRMNLKQGTTENYMKRIRLHIKPELGHYKLSALNTPSLQLFINEKAKQNYSRNSLSVIKGILSGSFNYAIKQNLIKNNPMYGVSLPSPRNESIKSRTAPHTYISQDRINEIFKRFPEGTSTHIPLLLGYKCGLRIGEAYALTWDCVDFKNKKLNINKQIQWDNEKGAWYFTAPKYESFREIEADDKLMEVLQHEKLKQEKAKNYYAELYTKLYVDSNRRINTTGNGSKVYPITIREDGTYIQPRTMQHTSSVIHHNMNFPQFTFHSLRHTHATMLAENDAPPKYVQERLGHKNIQVTMQIYQHLTEKISHRGADILSKMF